MKSAGIALVLGAITVALVACSLSSHLTPSARRNPTSWSAAIVRVVDGGTVALRLNARDVPVRLLGINTPETQTPSAPVQCGGPESTAFAHHTLDGLRVTLTSDPTQADVDRYGRLLRYITLPDGSDYSVDITRAGWARSVTYGPRPVQKATQLDAAQHQARVAHRGMWAICGLK